MLHINRLSHVMFTLSTTANLLNDLHKLEICLQIHTGTLYIILVKYFALNKSNSILMISTLQLFKVFI